RDDGTFVFKSVAAGPFFIRAELAGYIPEMYGNAPDIYNTPTPTLAPAQKLSGIRLGLTKGSVISGRLIDDRGAAVVGATVQAMKTTYRAGLRAPTMVQS